MTTVKKKKSEHLFHIPVMGTSFTIDTPLRVARFGISSVVSLCDDELCENMREFYSKKFNLIFEPIKKGSEDCRAKRITQYLNLLDDCVNKQIEEMKSQSFNEDNDLVAYFELLPESSNLKGLYKTMVKTDDNTEKEILQDTLRNSIVPGDIDVNIMTKLDRDTYGKDGQKNDQIFSDALSALRGFAQAKGSSSMVFSAGFNRRLFAYLESFSGFYPDKNGYIKKKIVLKVSDYRSSLIQGKFLAKKGIWVSEYRIESGLNCGGHAFATDGFLLGPILEEFKVNKSDLVSSLLVTCNNALKTSDKECFSVVPEVDITVQGGIGTSNENQFLIDYYNLKRTGWATPFLLVSEVTLVDYSTRQLLLNAKQDDLYLSKISPLGVPFNAVKGTASEHQKFTRFENGRPGSPCPKGYLVSNTEFSKKPVCTASVFYQKRKIESLKSQELTKGALDNAIQAVVNKVCLCEDLAAGALISNDIENKRSLKPAVCPGPNLAYFSSLSSLKDMVGHIYGRVNLLNDTYRPNLFVSELKMYVKYFKNEINKVTLAPSNLEIKYLQSFKRNINNGIVYYNELVPKLALETAKYRHKMLEELQDVSSEINDIVSKYSTIFPSVQPALAT
jgi:hypothetical protein